jgi:Mrr N-terminal domain
MSRQLPPIDDDIYEFIQAHAIPLEDDVNTVLRRMLGLETDPVKTRPTAVISPATNVAKEQRATQPRQKRRSVGTKADWQGKRTRPIKGSLLPESEYELPILRALDELGGWGAASEVIERVGKLLEADLTPEDHMQIASGLVRWKNRTQFVRLALIKSGDLIQGSPRGVWEISDQGRRRLTGAES